MTYPVDMQQKRQWLVYALESKDGKTKKDKIPLYIDGTKRRGRLGGSADLRRLATLEDAEDAYMFGIVPTARGIGFALLNTDDILCIDIDPGCDEALRDEILKRFPSFTEKSVSGEGFHIFLKCDYHRNLSNHNKHVELFGGNRFIAMTGEVVSENTELLEIKSDSEDFKWLLKEVGEKKIESSDAIQLDSTDIANMELEAFSRQANYSEIKDAMQYLLPCPEGDYHHWIGIGWALKSCLPEEEAFELWHEWSARSPNYHGWGATKDKFLALKDSRKYRKNTIFYHARKGGYNAFTENAPVRVDESGAILPFTINEKSKRIVATISNLNLALSHPHFCGYKIATDDFTADLVYAEASDENGAENWQRMSDTFYTKMRLRLEEECGFARLRKEDVREIILLTADKNRIDIAKEWLNGLEWDGVPRINTFMSTYFKTEDSEYSKAVSKYMWTAMAGRVLCPGIKADMVPILIGEQGCGKSTGVEALSPSLDYFCEISFNEKDDDLARKMRGRLVAEIGELRGLHTKELETIKAFITRTHEKWVPKYKEFAVQFPRRLLFIGTTNQSEFLADETGNRRFLPIEVGQIEVEAIKEDRDQLWAEARHFFKAKGMQINDAKELAAKQHEKHTIVDEWEDIIASWLDTPATFINEDESETIQSPAQKGYLALSEILRNALNIAPQHQNRTTQLRAARVLKKFGYISKLTKIRGHVSKRWIKNI